MQHTQCRLGWEGLWANWFFSLAMLKSAIGISDNKSCSSSIMLCQPCVIIDMHHMKAYIECYCYYSEDWRAKSGRNNGKKINVNPLLSIIAGLLLFLLGEFLVFLGYFNGFDFGISTLKTLLAIIFCSSSFTLFMEVTSPNVCIIIKGSLRSLPIVFTISEYYTK